MTQEIDPLVARYIAAFNARDTAAMIALSDPEVEIVPLRAALEDVVYRGHAGVEKWAEETAETWSELRLEVHETTEVAPDRILIVGKIAARGRAGGALTEIPIAFVSERRNGLVRRVETFLDLDAARRAAAEQT